MPGDFGFMPSSRILLMLLGLALVGTAFGDEQDDEEESSRTAGWNGSHPFIRSSDGDFEMEFGGRMHLDFRAYRADFAPSSTFLVRRARLSVEGVFYKYFDFKVQADFADVEGTLLRDGYLNIRARDSIQVTAGQFKAPFSQEELQSSRYIDFIERAMLNNIVPSRSPGVMVHGHTKDEVFEYGISAQNDRGELSLDETGQGPDLFGRVRFSPWTVGVLKNLSFGGAIGRGQREGESFLRGRTSSRSVVFADRVPLSGDLTRYNLEGWWFHRNVKIQAEYIEARAERLGLGDDGGDLPDVEANGIEIHGTYVLTGEEKGGDTSIKPKRPIREGGPGAWELGFRYQYFDVKGRNRADVYTIGINWWLNKFVRYQSNFSFERFREPPDPSTSETSNFASLSRIQVYF